MIALLTSLLANATLSGSVLALAALGEVLAERVGVTNLGVEGIMSVGAVSAVMTVAVFPNPWVGLLAATAAGILGGLVFGFASVVMRANQVLCGLAITFLGIGLSAAVGTSVAGMPVNSIFHPVAVPFLSRLPIVGPALFSQNVLLYFIYLVLPAAVHVLLFRTRHGLNIRAVGENPAAADAVGIPVTRIRLFYVMLGAAFAGAAGADLTLAVVPVWSDGMISGRGWIAVSLVIFAGYRPFMAVLAGLLFGLITAIGFVGQARGWPIAPAVLNMLPFLGTIAFIILPAVLWPNMRRIMGAPAALGKPYHRSMR